MRILTNLYAYVWQGNDNNCNSYLISNALTGNKHVLIDPGHITTPTYREPALAMLVKNMAVDGINMTDVGLIIITHAHPDHCESAKWLREQYGALVVLNKLEESMYKRIQGKADIYLQEGELVLSERIKLNIFQSPGHSPGHITIYWPEQKVLFTGDVIFYQNTGRFDLPGGDGRTLWLSIQKLSRLDVEYMLCGHAYRHEGVLKGKMAIQRNFDFIDRYMRTNFLS